MDSSKLLRAVLFFYECLRIVFILYLMSFVSEGTALGEISFPYAVFLSPNVLFPIMMLFAWLMPREHKNYLSLYMAGKALAIMLLIVWSIAITRNSSALAIIIFNMIFFGGSILIGLLDILSFWGAWILNGKYRNKNAPEIGGT